MAEELKEMLSKFGLLLEKCVVGAEMARSTEEQNKIELEEKTQRRSEMETAIDDNMWSIKAKIDTSKSLLDSRLALSRQHLEASVSSVKENEIFAEAKLLKIQRTELINEIVPVKEEIEGLKKNSANMKNNVVKDDHEYTEALIEIFNDNIANLKKEQQLLHSVLEKNNLYVNQLQQYLIKLSQYQVSIQEQALKMEEYRIKTNFQHALVQEFDKHMKVEKTTDEIDKNYISQVDDEAQMELILADKFYYLESLQSMIDKTVKMNLLLAVSQQRRNLSADMELDKEIELLKKRISELKNHRKTSVSGSESEDCDAEIDKIVDNVLQDESLLLQDPHSESKLEVKGDEVVKEAHIEVETLSQEVKESTKDIEKTEGGSGERSASDDLNHIINVPEPQLSEDEPDSQDSTTTWISVLSNK